MRVEVAKVGSMEAGFLSDGEAGMKVVLPACYRRDEKFSFDDIALLVRTLRRYRAERPELNAVRREERKRLLAATATRQRPADVERLEVGLDLLDDFRLHGALRFDHQKVSREERGAIDWPRTLTADLPAWCEGTPLHVTPFRRRNVWNSAHPLADLHVATLAHLDYALSAGIGSLPYRAERYDPTRNPNAAARLAREQMPRIFRERDRHVCQLLARYWEDAPIGGKGVVPENWEYSENFEAVWEMMCRKVLPSGSQGKLPDHAGKYVGLDGKPLDRDRGYKPRPDFVIEANDGTLLVLDAKFYVSDGTTKNLPQTPDILKQLAYAFFSSKDWDSSSPFSRERVRNAFLFPEMPDPVGTSCWLTILGRHRMPAPWDRPMAGHIWLIYLDYRRVAAAYSRREQLPLEELVTAIRDAATVAA